MGKLFDGKLVFTQIPLLLKYLPVTMELAVTAMIASLILGLLLALVKIKKVPVLKQLVSIYISVIRGTPILVQLYVTYFGIPMLLKYINFKCGTNYNVNGVAPIVYAFVALALNESAFNAEIIRASLESVDKTIIRDICQVVSSRELQSQEHLRWSQSFCFWMSRHLH